MKIPAMKNIGRTLRPLTTILLLTACAGPTPTDRTVVLNDLYQKSIASAAVKLPDFDHALQPIDASRPKVTVVHIQPYPTIDTTRFTWVTLPEALQALCRGKADPLLAMQQALGLPPEKRDDVKVFTFDVQPKDIFRPCASSPDITTTKCTVDLPVASIGSQAATEHFVLKQMMDSYRSGFKGPGYPFTAMGWSYDWSPESFAHQGVSEYVVKPHAIISNVASVAPAAFCGAP